MEYPGCIRDPSDPVKPTVVEKVWRFHSKLLRSPVQPEPVATSGFLLHIDCIGAWHLLDQVCWSNTIVLS